MNEDDTFRVLRQVPYKRMEEIVFEFKYKNGIPPQHLPEELFTQNGWTYKDYRSEWVFRNTKARDASGFTF